MPPNKEKSALKRARASQGEQAADPKKPRRSDRISSQIESSIHPPPSEPKKVPQKSQLPSPVTNGRSTITDKEGTATPPEGRPSQIQHRSPPSSLAYFHGLTSPPNDTQTQQMSQFTQNARDVFHGIEDEKGQGVWGYLLPTKDSIGKELILRQRSACPLPANILKKTGKFRRGGYKEQEQQYEDAKVDDMPSGGYLIGRHPECDMILDIPTISNRHCLLFSENKGGNAVAIIEDISGNGTYVNESFIGRNKRRELQDGDEIAVLNEARFVFRAPRVTHSHGFHEQFSIEEQLGKGHFATVYLTLEKKSGMKYAVKKFEKQSGPGEKSKVEGLQQEIGVLMGVSHPNVLCLKDTFDEEDGVYLVLELAVEGELFNLIVMKSKLSQSETRKIFVQLFQATKYLHERNIVHRDIKPENILLVDKDLGVKLADFGLSKIIGEESFTTTLCGTPSYVAPEILENSDHRRYTRAVDVWSLGVVLYICLCGFPPFSDELYSKQNPYTLSQQIKNGWFDYPSPYWDSVDDQALDLIDRMLTVDVEKRISIDECLQHPWLTQQSIDPADSTDGLTGAMDSLDFSKRKPHRERTQLSAINEVKVSRIVEVHPDQPPVKVFEKNNGKAGLTQREWNHRMKNSNGNKPEDKHAFMQTGDAHPDDPLFGDDGTSNYPNESTRPNQ